MEVLKTPKNISKFDFRHLSNLGEEKRMLTKFIKYSY